MQRADAAVARGKPANPPRHRARREPRNGSGLTLLVAPPGCDQSPGLAVLSVPLPQQARSALRPLLDRPLQQEQIAPIPGMDAERAALKEAGLFSRIDSTPDMVADSTLEVMNTRLGNLRLVKTGETVVVNIAAYAMVDGTGGVQILASDSDPFTVKTMLPLCPVLTEAAPVPCRGTSSWYLMSCAHRIIRSIWAGHPTGSRTPSATSCRPRRTPDSPTIPPSWSWPPALPARSGSGRRASESRHSRPLLPWCLHRPPSRYRSQQDHQREGSRRLRDREGGSVGQSVPWRGAAALPWWALRPISTLPPWSVTSEAPGPKPAASEKDGAGREGRREGQGCRRQAGCSRGEKVVRYDKGRQGCGQDPTTGRKPRAAEPATAFRSRSTWLSR